MANCKPKLPGYTPLRRALNAIPNISEFCVRHNLSRRTLYRILRPDGTATSPETMAAVQDALRKDGLLATKEKA